MNYTIESQGEAKWKITIGWDGAKDDTQEIIFWITEGDMRYGTLKAVGNVYDAKGQPMWPSGEKSMEMLFTSGKHQGLRMNNAEEFETEVRIERGAAAFAAQAQFTRMISQDFDG